MYNDFVILDQTDSIIGTGWLICSILLYCKEVITVINNPPLMCYGFISQFSCYPDFFSIK